MDQWVGNVEVIGAEVHLWMNCPFALLMKLISITTSTDRRLSKMNGRDAVHLCCVIRRMYQLIE